MLDELGPRKAAPGQLQSSAGQTYLLESGRSRIRVAETRIMLHARYARNRHWPGSGIPLDPEFIVPRKTAIGNVWLKGGQRTHELGLWNF